MSQFSLVTTVTLDSVGSGVSGLLRWPLVLFLWIYMREIFLLFQYDKLNEISSKTTNFFSVAEKIGSFVVKVEI